jgi:hypothetical protein
MKSMEAERWCPEVAASPGATEAVLAMMTDTPTESADETSMARTAAGNEHAVSRRGGPDMAAAAPASP